MRIASLAKPIASAAKHISFEAKRPLKLFWTIKLLLFVINIDMAWFWELNHNCLFINLF
jgi:hypothetical protein